MNIIIDTREQKPLSFTGHKTTRRKLDEGDYNIEELEDKIVIERKSIPDLYGSIINGHARFRDELLRSRFKDKKFYLFLEGDRIKFLLYTKSRGMRIDTMNKILDTMIKKYGIILIECFNREEMKLKIMQTLQINKKLYGVK